MRIKRFSSLDGADFDKFLTAFCKIQEAVRTDVYRVGLSPYPAWIGFICQPTTFAKEFWVIEDNLGRAIGRVGANCLVANPKEGAIGFFEVDLKHPEASAAGQSLLSAAEAWLRENHVTTVFGPMNFNSWYQYRFSLPGGTKPFAWEPVHPPEYLEIWREAGYETARSFESRAYADLDLQVEQTKSDYEKARADKIEFRAVDRLQGIVPDMRSIYELSLASDHDGAPFEPITFEVFRGLQVGTSGKGDYSQLALGPDGKARGLIEAFEDQGYLVIRRILTGTSGQPLAQALFHAVGLKASEKKVSKFLTALVRDGQFAPRGSTELWSRHYVLLKKTLV